MVQLISTEILPFANFIPKDFVGQIMAMLNRGSIHSQSPSFTGETLGKSPSVVSSVNHSAAVGRTSKYPNVGCSS